MHISNMTMLLENLAKNGSYIYTERYVNQFKKVANEVSLEYCAVSGVDSFKLPHKILTAKDVDIYLANPDKEILDKIIAGDSVKFFVHPDTIANEEGYQAKTIVEPTSSTRTVLPKGGTFAIKLHLNRRLSRYIRRLTKSSVEHSLKVSSELEKSVGSCPSSFGYLPESIGIVYKGIGMIIREMTPRPVAEDKRMLVPLFSLYSRDMNSEDEPLLVQMIMSKNMEPLDFFIEKIVNPLFASVSYFITESGLLLEAHGQNVLAELDNEYDITRLIHRDFQSIYIDQEIRNRNGLEKIFTKHIMGEECPKEVTYSLVYDNFIGNYMLDNFVELIYSCWGIEPETITERIKESFKLYFDSSLFHEGCYYMLSKGTFNGNDTAVTRYETLPRYRP